MRTRLEIALWFGALGTIVVLASLALPRHAVAQAPGQSEHAEIALSTTRAEIKPDSGRAFTSYRCTSEGAVDLYVGDSTVTTSDYGELVTSGDPVQADLTTGEWVVLASSTDTLHCRFKVGY